MWTAASAAVCVTLTIATLISLLASIVLVTRREGRTKVKVTLLGFGFAIEHDTNPEKEAKKDEPPKEIGSATRKWRRKTRMKPEV